VGSAYIGALSKSFRAFFCFYFAFIFCFLFCLAWLLYMFIKVIKVIKVITMCGQVITMFIFCGLGGFIVIKVIKLLGSSQAWSPGQGHQVVRKFTT
jgi:hypothetical protein